MRVALLILAMAAGSAAGHAQGCSQCREQVGQTPAATRTGYRRAIAVLMVAGLGVFGAGIVVLRKFR